MRIQLTIPETKDARFTKTGWTTINRGWREDVINKGITKCSADSCVYLREIYTVEKKRNSLRFKMIVLKVPMIERTFYSYKSVLLRKGISTNG